jgi:hypothetical protein
MFSDLFSDMGTAYWFLFSSLYNSIDEVYLFHQLFDSLWLTSKNQTLSSSFYFIIKVKGRLE